MRQCGRVQGEEFSFGARNGKGHERQDISCVSWVMPRSGAHHVGDTRPPRGQGAGCEWWARVVEVLLGF